MQYKTVYKHKHNAIYNVYTPVCYAYEGYAKQFSDDPIVYETFVQRVFVRKNAVYIECCGELGELASKCSNLLAVFKPVLAALALNNCELHDSAVYGTNEGGCFIVLHK